MKKNSALFCVAFICLLSFLSCDKDFNEIGTDIVGEDHYTFSEDLTKTVRAYNQKLGAVSMNNLPINALGKYTNDAFGTTEASFVTQVELSVTSPVFKTTNPENYPGFVLPVVDSVILEVPYISRLKSTNAEGQKTYTLDSIYGVQDDSKFGLEVYESGYFLRDLDPNEQFTASQVFYNDIENEIEQNKINFKLNNGARREQNVDFFFDKREHLLRIRNENGELVPDKRIPPSMRLELDPTYFYNKIINAPSGSLASNGAFKNYFRGLYFKTINPKNMALLNFNAGTIIMYYQEDSFIPDNPNTTTVNEFDRKRVFKTYRMNLKGNTVNLLKNNDTNPSYISAINNPSQEASKIFLKGGQGSIAIIDLFNPIDQYKYIIATDNAGNQLKDDEGNLLYIKSLSSNGVSDELDDLRFPKVNGDNIYYSKKNRWLVNEANLTFYIDQFSLNLNNNKDFEPNRIFLYDLNNSKPIIDYISDQSTAGYTKQNKFIYGGILTNNDGTVTKQIKNDEGIVTNRGTKYKIRLTNHLKSLIRNSDSTNVRLGLCITENININENAKLKTPIVTSNGTIKKVPKMSTMSPTGTILYGSSQDVPEDKRLKLQIYYTKPD